MMVKKARLPPRECQSQGHECDHDSVRDRSVRDCGRYSRDQRDRNHHRSSYSDGDGEARPWKEGQGFWPKHTLSSSDRSRSRSPVHRTESDKPRISPFGKAPEPSYLAKLKDLYGDATKQTQRTMSVMVEAARILEPKRWSDWEAQGGGECWMKHHKIASVSCTIKDLGLSSATAGVAYKKWSCSACSVVYFSATPPLGYHTLSNCTHPWIPISICFYENGQNQFGPVSLVHQKSIGYNLKNKNFEKMKSEKMSDKLFSI
jgi:hypothetical protein